MSDFMKMSDALAKFYASTKKWKLTANETSILLGVSELEFIEIQNTSELLINSPLYNRMNLICQINEALSRVSPDGAFDHFLNHPYPERPLSGMSIREFLIKNPSIDSHRVIFNWLMGMLV